jgi:hypothetical protein
MSDDKRHKTEMNTDQAVMAEATGVSSPVSLPVELQGAIGKQLKHVYGQMLAEPMPDKFAKLLESLSKSEPNS